ncbi:competence protein ComK [Virgibacillus sp. MSJ-26]|uniref:competence protein ComK n=1 Tax=Virgibacillus sp. MSJ-26 TaxID=2841522 RepID=UPI001C10FEF0|nr:competence protein ComK [Virgibacillus sp. MSJ-26]MBU5468370.1 competence protein ComK [Virgibacillus sp. MSJ-26]
MNNKFNSPTYEITPQTMAVLVHCDERGHTGAWILEESDDYYVDNSPSKVIDQSCRFFGSSLKGRQEGTFNVCRITHKAPISIDPSNGMYFFPTTSPVNPRCSWIAHSHVAQVNNLKDNFTEIVFNNGRKLPIQVSFGSIQNQLHRTAQFRFLLDKRISHLRPQAADRVAEPFAQILE